MIFEKYNLSTGETAQRVQKRPAKRYYDLNQSALPTGSRIATIDMQTLYNKAYLKEDLYVPFTNEPCSIKESWVKVKKENGEYKYYTYLKQLIKNKNR